MPRNAFTALLVFLGLSSGPTLARELQVEAEVLHVGGLLSPQELEAMLADARLEIEATYQPTRLIEGVTATRQRTMPFGSRLYAISRQLKLEGAQIAREGRRLRLRVPGEHPQHDHYRLNQLSVRMPVAPGIGRPQPHLRLDLFREPPKAGTAETVHFIRSGVFELALRVRYGPGDVQAAAPAAPVVCDGDIQPLGNGEYRFRPRHRMDGLFRFLSPVVSSDPPSRPPAGQRSVRLREPYPGPLAGWELSRNHLVQMQIDGQTVERFSVYAEQKGDGTCRRTRGYDALFAGGKLVALERSVHAYNCGAEDSARNHTVMAAWLDDGSLARHTVSSAQGSTTWDAFNASAAEVCKTDTAPPPDSDVQAVIAEIQRIREAFLAP